MLSLSVGNTFYNEDIFSHSSELNNMQKKDLGGLRHENRRDGSTMNKSINPALFSLVIP